MTEPNLDPGRVPDVQTVPGEPHLVPAVFDLESPLDVRLSDDAYRAAFHDFYVTARDRVGRALALTLHDDDLAADAVDEAMVRAFQRWSKVRQLDNPAGWAYRVGLNHARSRVRRLGRRLTHGARVAGRDETLDGEPAEPTVVAALGELTVDQRSVVVCRVLLDWSEAETASALGLRPGTVKSRLSRALAQLEPRLDHLHQEER